MTKLFVVTILTFLAGVSLWGWGRTAVRSARAAALPVALTLALGLAVLVFLGGLLNLLHVAYAPVLDLVAVGGLLLAIIHARQDGRLKLPGRPTRETVLTLLPILLAGWFLASHLLPQVAFNVHDDLEKYFAHPVKMLADGSFGANPLNSLGGEALGGQAFLQSFVVAHLPLEYLGAVDAYFCALLCVALAGFAAKPQPWAAGALLAQAAVLVLNPQLVNIAAVYSASALAMAAMFLPAHPARPAQTEPSAALLGLLYAGLIVLKTTLLLFVAIHFAILVVLGLLVRRIRWTWAVQPPLWTVLFLAPWLGVHAKLYLARPSAIAVPGNATAPAFEFWSTAPLSYDATALHYTTLAVGAIMVGAVLVALMRTRRLPVSAPLLAAATAGLGMGAVYFSMTAGFGPHFAGADAALRYTCPILIATIPVLLRLTESIGEQPGFRLTPWIVNSLGAAAILAFLPSAGGRAIQIARLETTLAFLPRASVAAQTKYIEYNQASLDPSGAIRTRLRAIQELVPAGETVGAWVMTPYWLDFKRNEVFAADPAGLSMRWSRRPAAMRYFIYQQAGFAVRPLATYHQQLVSDIPVDRLFGSHTLAFLEQLHADTEQVLYNDGNYVLLQLRATSPRQE